MAEKRIKFSGFIALPDGAELPPIGATITGTYVAEVKGDHVDRDAREAEGGALVRTAPAVLKEGSTLDNVKPPSGPLDEAMEPEPDWAEGAEV